MRYVGIGGTLRDNSSSEALLRLCMSYLEAGGHQVRVFSGAEINLPMYDPKEPTRSPAASDLVNAVREADGIVLASPGYHGSVSGLVKNSIDYLEDTVRDHRPYFDGMPVGCIAAAFGLQAAVATMGALRGIVHSLRGWPTPYGASVNTQLWCDESGKITEEVDTQIRLIAEQILSFPERGTGMEPSGAGRQVSTA